MTNIKDVKIEIKESLEFDLEKIGTVEQKREYIDAEIAKHTEIADKHKDKLRQINNMSSEAFKEYLIDSDQESLEREYDLRLAYMTDLSAHEQAVEDCNDVLSRTNSNMLKVRVSKFKQHREHLVNNTNKQLALVEQRIAALEEKIANYNNVDTELLNDIKERKICSIENMLKRENEILDKLISGDGFHNKTIHIIEEGNQALKEITEMIDE